LAYEFDEFNDVLTNVTLSINEPDEHSGLGYSIVSNDAPINAFTITTIVEQGLDYRMHIMCSNRDSWPVYQPLLIDLPYSFTYVSRRSPGVYCGWTTSNMSLTIWPFETRFNYIPLGLRIIGTYSHITVAVDHRLSETCILDYHVPRFRFAPMLATQCYVGDTEVYLADRCSFYVVQLQTGSISLIAELPSPIAEIDHTVLLCDDGSLWEYVNYMLISVGQLASIWN
jgi:hypothetical protein